MSFDNDIRFSEDLYEQEAYAQWEARVSMNAENRTLMSSFAEGDYIQQNYTEELPKISHVDITKGQSQMVFVEEPAQPKIIPRQSDTDIEARLQRLVTRKNAFETYQETLPPDQQEFSKKVVEQIYTTPGRLVLPDNKLLPSMVPFPPNVNLSKGEAPFVFDASTGSTDEVFYQGSPFLVETINITIPEKNELKDVNKHPNKTRKPEEILAALQSDGTLGFKFFGNLVADKMANVDTKQRNAVAKKILEVLKDGVVEEPNRKIPRPV